MASCLRGGARIRACHLDLLVFGAGLLLSGMSQPGKVLAFLDVGGAWDPSLALAMAGAIAVAGPAFALAKRRSSSLLGEPMDLPKARQIDGPLMIGSLLFGIGWGIAGLCPGPAVVALTIGGEKAVIFAASMLAGFVLHKLLGKYRRP